MGRVSLLILVAVVGAQSLVVPKYRGNHHDALSKGNGSEEDLQTWHGLDYEFTAFDHSEWERDHPQGQKNNSDEDDSYMDDIILDVSKKPSSTRKPGILEEKRNGSGNMEGVKDDDDKVITIGVKKGTPPPVPVKAGGKKKDEINQDYNWVETEGDSDDGEEDKPKKVGDLPSDNDLDKDKYFDPDRYKDTISLHAIENILMRQWTVSYPETNLPCIMLRGSIKLIVPLSPSWYNEDFVAIDVPYDADASGSCNSLGNDYQEIILTWNVTSGESGKTYGNQVVFGFATNWTSEFTELNIPEDKYALLSVTATYYKGELGLKEGDTGIISYSVKDLAEFMTPLNQSMSCYQNKQILLGSMQLTLSGIQLEAFRPNRENLVVGDFSRSVLCSMDEVFVFDAVMTFIIWFWIGALIVVLFIFIVLLALGYRRRQGQQGEGFGYKILQA